MAQALRCISGCNCAAHKALQVHHIKCPLLASQARNELFPVQVWTASHTLCR